MASTEISVRLEPGLLQFAEAAAAAREDRSLSWLIRHALAEYARRSGDGTTRGVAARLHGSASHFTKLTIVRQSKHSCRSGQQWQRHDRTWQIIPNTAGPFHICLTRMIDVTAIADDGREVPQCGKREYFGTVQSFPPFRVQYFRLKAAKSSFRVVGQFSATYSDLVCEDARRG